MMAVRHPDRPCRNKLQDNGSTRFEVEPISVSVPRNSCFSFLFTVVTPGVAARSAKCYAGPGGRDKDWAAFRTLRNRVDSKSRQRAS
jgi:hypothetical protein